MKTWHTCEVCGFSSEDPNEVQACEGQYRTNKYQEGDAVKVALIPHRFDQRDNDKLWLQGTVIGVTFAHKTHQPQYKVLLSQSEYTLFVSQEDITIESI